MNIKNKSTILNNINLLFQVALNQTQEKDKPTYSNEKEFRQQILNSTKKTISFLKKTKSENITHVKKLNETIEIFSCKEIQNKFGQTQNFIEGHWFSFFDLNVIDEIEGDDKNYLLNHIKIIQVFAHDVFTNKIIVQETLFLNDFLKKFHIQGEIKQSLQEFCNNYLNKTLENDIEKENFFHFLKQKYFQNKLEKQSEYFLVDILETHTNEHNKNKNTGLVCDRNYFYLNEETFYKNNTNNKAISFLPVDSFQLSLYSPIKKNYLILIVRTHIEIEIKDQTKIKRYKSQATISINEELKNFL